MRPDLTDASLVEPTLWSHQHEFKAFPTIQWNGLGFPPGQAGSRVSSPYPVNRHDQTTSANASATAVTFHLGVAQSIRGKGASEVDNVVGSFSNDDDRQNTVLSSNLLHC